MHLVDFIIRINACILLYMFFGVLKTTFIHFCIWIFDILQLPIFFSRYFADVFAVLRCLSFGMSAGPVAGAPRRSPITELLPVGIFS